MRISTHKFKAAHTTSALIHSKTMLHHLKRGLSDEDDDDDFDETCAVTASSEVVAAAQNASGGGGTRKRRRGIIEKRRRDRINTSLNELKRLVPTALEKSGSAKLEKAEILQLTVDHLKVLQARGISSETSFDPHRLAADYHAVGFRECAAEVARYEHYSPRQKSSHVHKVTPVLLPSGTCPPLRA